MGEMKKPLATSHQPSGKSRKVARTPPSGHPEKKSGSGIEWCNETWEVTAGCTKVSGGCKHCYAETLVGGRFKGFARKRERDGAANGSAIDISLDVITNPRDPDKRSRWNGQVRELAMNLDQPLRRRAPTVYFVNSRSDLFHEGVSFEYIDRVFAVMALCPRHRFLVLTKRPERMRAYLEDRMPCGDMPVTRGGGISRSEGGTLEIRRAMYEFDREYVLNLIPRDFDANWPLPNVWLGTSVEDQATADARLPELLACPAAGRFVSAEPLLGEVDIREHFARYVSEVSGLRYSNPKAAGDHCELPGLGWVIVGGESGPGARACNVQHIRSIKDQCQHAGVPVFVKQLGADLRVDWDAKDYEGYPPVIELKDRKGGDMREWPKDLRVREVPAGLVLGGEKTPLRHASRATSPRGAGRSKGGRDG